MKCGIHSINGKMGQAIMHLVGEYPSLTLAAGFVRRGHEWSGEKISDVCAIDAGNVRATSNLESFCNASDVVIDFTRPEAALELLPICRKLRKPLVIGTTGFNEKAKKWISEASNDIPIILAANTSIGVNILIEVSRQVARALDKKDWHADILELHHQHKVDAPSGTALRLGEAIAEAQGDAFSDRSVYPYQGRRKEDDIGFAVIRAGEIIGEHSVYFTSGDERIELTHRAHDRRIFARGALEAAIWLEGKAPGLYSMADVLGFNESKK